jgi:hypothetical protein
MRVLGKQLAEVRMTRWKMKKVLLQTVAFAAVSAFIRDVRADDGTWTMPYLGSCSDPDACIGVTNSDSGNGFGIAGVAQGGDGVYGYSWEATGVNGEGFWGVRGTGISGVIGAGYYYGVEASGGLAPIYMSGTIPGYGGGVALCKETGGSSAGGVGYCSSGRAMKRDIHDLELGIETVMQLRPRAFQWRSNNSADIGFIADEVARVNPILAVYNEEGELQSVKYSQLTALLTKALQDQVRERNSIEEDLRKQLSALDRRNAELSSQLRDQQALINNLASRLGAVEQRAHLK